MRPTGVMRFVLFGAAGFGIGGAIASVSGDAMLLGFFAMGALGGASLGLATNDMRRTLTLALMGALGFGVGFLVAFAIVMLIWDPFGNWFLGVVGGTLGGASLGISSLDWRRIMTLAVAGAVGFGVGWVLTDVFLEALYENLANSRVPGYVFVILFAAEGTIGGASLGAALGYLEKRKLNEQRRPRVR